MMYSSMTGPELTDRLLSNIQTSLELRARIPFLDMLKELAEGGAALSSAALNTSSNFGSFDRYLSEILVFLHASDCRFALHTALPLQLSRIADNLGAHADLLSTILQHDLDHTDKSSEILYRLDLVDAAAV